MLRLRLQSSVLSRASRTAASSRHVLPTTSSGPRRHFASTVATEKGQQNSRPGWEGRHGDDHAVERDRHDVQGDASQEGMKKFEQEKQSDRPQSATSGQAISRKDERNNNQRAHEEHPEAPGPVIGMNEERGSKGH